MLKLFRSVIAIAVFAGLSAPTRAGGKLPETACEDVVVMTNFVFEAKPANSLSKDFTRSVNAFARPMAGSVAAGPCEGPRQVVVSTDADYAAFKDLTEALASKGIDLRGGGALIELIDRRASASAAPDGGIITGSAGTPAPTGDAVAK
jgi:hypothetical protein